MRRFGLRAAEELQEQSSTMTGTELYAEEGYIPDFSAAVAAKNMLQRSPGFLCCSTAGRVVKLLQAYDSDIYPQEPEDLPSQWGFYWSTDPLKALPFVSIATSPYATGNCCTHDGHVWRSGQDGNVWEPGSVGVSWTDLGTIEDVMNGTAMEPDKPSADEPEEPSDDIIRAERGMAYVFGKKYFDPEDGKTYLCARDGEEEGGSVTLSYLPHELVGHYFTEV